MKKIVIFQNGGGELANQLWNYMSIYAYSREVDAKINNPSFFEYGSHFKIHQPPLANLLLFKPFKNHHGRRGAPRRKIWRTLYKIYIVYIRIFKKHSTISSINRDNSVTYLPPSSNNVDIPNKDTIYFEGWLFRNPSGLKKYRQEILDYFRPKESVLKNLNTFLSPIQSSHVVGVHIRQGDYKTFKSGKYFIDQKRVREIIDEYLVFSHNTSENTHFIITSDGPIDQRMFDGLQSSVSDMGPVEDLFLLSKTDLVLGSDSSFGDLAAWYGDIPHIVFQKDSIDWEYYRDKKTFFENKYSTMVHY